MTVDHHTVAAISIAGTCLDVLGSMYLAYDLLGGQHGPLRLLTRMVTYSIIFGLGYGLGTGHLIFGLACGAATGITIAIEFNKASKTNGGHYSLPWEAFFSAIRGIAFGASLYTIVGFRFAVAFATLSTAGQILAYLRGVRPALDYEAARRTRLTQRHINSVMVRTAGNIAAAIICGTFVQHLEHPWLFAIRFGVVVGVVTAVGTLVNPFVEYYADSLAERRLGAFGIGLIFCGFVLQSLQYWLAIFDVRLT